MSHLLGLALLSGALVLAPNSPVHAQGRNDATAGSSPIAARRLPMDSADVAFQRVDWHGHGHGHYGYGGYGYGHGHGYGYGRGGGPGWGYHGGGWGAPYYGRGWGGGWGYPGYGYRPPIVISPFRPYLSPMPFYPY
jgi:hypothetical protein